MKQLTKCLLLFFLLAGMVFSVQAQKKAVSGTVVKEDNNEPLQGVTVTVKGTTQTAITDAKGFFSMTVANNDGRLNTQSEAQVCQCQFKGNQCKLNLNWGQRFEAFCTTINQSFETRKPLSLTNVIVL